MIGQKGCIRVRWEHFQGLGHLGVYSQAFPQVGRVEHGTGKVKVKGRVQFVPNVLHHRNRRTPNFPNGERLRVDAFVEGTEIFQLSIGRRLERELGVRQGE